MSNVHFAQFPSSPDPRRAFLEGLYRAHSLELHRFLAAQYGRGPPEPADVVQATFAHVAALAHPEALGNPRAFLYRTARNLFIDHRRRMETHRKLAQEVKQREEDAPSFELPVERVLIGEEDWRVLEEAILRMPERRRRCFLLHRLQGLSFAEIARQVGMTGAGVSKIIGKALADCERAMAAGSQRMEGKIR